MCYQITHKHNLDFMYISTREVIVQSPHRNRTEPVRLPYGGRAEMVRWLCDRLEVLVIRVPKVYNTFLLVFSVETAPKPKGWKGKRSKKDMQPKPEMPAVSDIERPDEDEPDDDEEAAIIDKIVQFFEDRPYFYDIVHEGRSARGLFAVLRRVHGLRACNFLKFVIVRS